jgi:hypothetical protein
MALGQGFRIRLRALEARLGLRLDPAVRAQERMRKASDDLGERFGAAGLDPQVAVGRALDVLLTRLDVELTERGALPEEGGPDDTSPEGLASAVAAAWASWGELCEAAGFGPEGTYDRFVGEAVGVMAGCEGGNEHGGR